MKIMPQPRQRGHNQGFTLVEVLVAVTIFAILSTTAVVGMNEVLITRSEVDESMDRLHELQRTMLFLTRDIQQSVARDIHDQYGDLQPAFVGSDFNQNVDAPIIEMTRGGYPNPLGVARSNLQRVAYRIRDDTLYRITWRTLDRAPDSKPHAARLCSKVTEMNIRYLDPAGHWHNHWPPVALGTSAPVLPNAVEVTLELSDWGSIVRLLQLVGEESS